MVTGLLLGTLLLETGLLETGLLEPRLLDPRLLEPRLLETGLLETLLLETLLLETRLLETGLLEAGLLETGLLETWLLVPRPLVALLLVTWLLKSRLLISWLRGSILRFLEFRNCLLVILGSRLFFGIFLHQFFCLGNAQPQDFIIRDCGFFAQTSQFSRTENLLPLQGAHHLPIDFHIHSHCCVSIYRKARFPKSERSLDITTKTYPEFFRVDEIHLYAALPHVLPGFNENPVTSAVAKHGQEI